jgi:hypothetical protein
MSIRKNAYFYQRKSHPIGVVPITDLDGHYLQFCMALKNLDTMKKPLAGIPGAKG